MALSSAASYAPYRTFVVRANRIPNTEASLLIYDKHASVMLVTEISIADRKLLDNGHETYLVAFFDEDKYLHLLERAPDQHWTC